MPEVSQLIPVRPLETPLPVQAPVKYQPARQLLLTLHPLPDLPFCLPRRGCFLFTVPRHKVVSYLLLVSNFFLLVTFALALGKQQSGRFT